MSDLWTIQKLILWAQDYLTKRGVENARLDVELLLAHTLNLSRIKLYTEWQRPLNDTELKSFKTQLQRRATREPVAYILGKKEFFSLEFEVNQDVLIPRPETEELVERGINHLKNLKQDEFKILDLATGSGCILTALLKNLPKATGIGVDQSKAALVIAEKNAEKHEVKDQITWIPQDLSQTWPESLQGPFDLITANLPYVSKSEYENLAPEITKFEPKAALTPGEKGTESFAWILPNLTSRLKKGGIVLLEIGADQTAILLFQTKQYCPELKVEVKQDLSGRDRFLKLTSK